MQSTCWAADSKGLYFVSEDGGGIPPTTPNYRWVGNNPDDPPAAPTTKPATISLWRDGKTKPVVAVAGCVIGSVAPSPDGKWLAFTGDRSGHFGPKFSTSLICTPRQLYEVDRHGSRPAFTGPDRLAYVVDAHGTGRVAEVILDPSTDNLNFNALANVLTDSTSTPQPAGDALVFVTKAATFRHRPTPRPNRWSSAPTEPATSASYVPRRPPPSAPTAAEFCSSKTTPKAPATCRSWTPTAPTSAS